MEMRRFQGFDEVHFQDGMVIDFFHPDDVKKRMCHYIQRINWTTVAVPRH